MDGDLRQVVDAIPTILLTVLPDGSVDYTNRPWVEYTGLGVSEARGSGWLKAIHPDDLAHVHSGWPPVNLTGRRDDFKARLRRGDGIYRWFLFRTSTLGDEDGDAARWCAVLTDIDDIGPARDLTRGQEEVRPSEALLKSIIDTIPGFVWSTTPDGTVDFLNKGWCDYTGVSMAEALRIGWERSVHPDDYDGLMRYWRGPLETGSPGEYECRHRRFDGAYRWFVGRAIPLRNHAGAIVRWFGLNTDIDDRKRAELLLAGKNRLLEMLAGDSPLDPVLDDLCTLADSTIDGASCCVLLLSERGDRLHCVAAPGLPEGFVDSIDALPLQVESGPCATTVLLARQTIATDLTPDERWQDGPWFPLAATLGMETCWSTPVLSANGQVLAVFASFFRAARSPSAQEQGFLAQFTHIASVAIQRIQGDASRKRSEAFLAEVQRLSLTGGLLWYVSDDRLIWSEEIYRIFEVDTRLTPTLELIKTRLHPDDVAGFEEMYFRQLTDFTDFEHDHRLRMTDGTIKHLHVVAHANVDHNGQRRYTAAVQDVTDRRRSDEALMGLRSDLARVARVTSFGTLTASIAHEVNQPLSGIITNAGTCLRMLAADPPNVPGAIETARRTIRDGNRAADVINRLRALFSKQDASVESVDLNEAVRAVVALSRSELAAKRVVVKIDLAETLPPALGDRVQLQQVILNLLLNAADALSDVHDRSRQVLVRTSQDSFDRIRVSVRDTGIGLSAGVAERIFDAFYTTKPGGMGIGLSVSRSIIESHQGKIWAEANDGPGATFAFCVPRSPVDTPALGEERPVRPVFSGAAGQECPPAS